MFRRTRPEHRPARLRRRAGATAALVLGAVTLSTLGATPALAAMDAPVTASVPLHITMYATTMSVAQFAPQRGTLTSVACVLTGEVQGDAQVESKDTAPATVTANLTATLHLERPDATLITQVLPLVSTTDTVAAYDGVTDFAGPSGRSHYGLTGSAVAAVSLTSPADLALFTAPVTGPGVVELRLSATAGSTASGPGNVVQAFSTNAGAELACTYHYIPAPRTADDAAATSGDLPVAIPVLANDSGDQDGGQQGGTLVPATTTVIAAPADGTTVVNPTTGAITYTAAAGFVGTDTFGYQVCNNFGLCRPATVTVTVAPPQSDLAVTATSSALPAGGAGTFTVVVTNNGPNATLGDSTATVTLPAGLTVTGSSSAPAGFVCDTGAGPVVCTSTASLASGAQSTIVLNVAIANDAVGAKTLTVVVANMNLDVVPGNNTATVTTSVQEVHDLSIVETLEPGQAPQSGQIPPAAGDVLAGTTATYSSVITNSGPSATAGTIAFTDTLPAGLGYLAASGDGFTCTTAGQQVTCTSDIPLASGQSRTVTLMTTVDPSLTGVVVNTSMVSAPNGLDPIGTNNTSTVSSPVATSIDAGVVLNGPSGLTVGQSADYGVAVTSNGPSTTGPLTVTTTLPAGLTFVTGGSAASGFTCSAAGQLVTCSRPGGLLPGANNAVSYPFTVAVGPDATTPTSVTVTVATAGDTDPTNNDSTIELPVTPTVDEGITLTGPVGGFTYSTGSVPAAYAVVVTNHGPSASDVSTVTLTLPAGITFVSADGTTGFTCDLTGGQTLTCTRPEPIPAGDSVELGLTVFASPGTVSPAVTSATVATANDRNPANDTASVSTPIVTSSDLGLSKTTLGELVVGTQQTYTLTVTNFGPSPTAGPVTVTDLLPAGLTFVSGSGGGFSCSAVGQQVSCVLSEPIMVGDSALIALVVATELAGYPEVTNTATVSTAGAADDPNPVNNTASVTSTTRAATLAGRLFRDVNGNGLQDAGDVGLPGGVVQLLRAGTVVATTTTGSNGRYVFTGLAPDTYQVHFASTSADLGFTRALVGPDRTVDSDALSATGTTGGIRLAAGQDLDSIDAGLLSLIGSVSGVDYHDLNDDGRQQAGEPGLAGVLVTLTGTDELGQSVLLTTTTGAQGEFLFGHLRPGSYSVSRVHPAGLLDGKDAGPAGSIVTDHVVGSIRVNGVPMAGVLLAEVAPAAQVVPVARAVPRHLIPLPFTGGDIRLVGQWALGLLGVGLLLLLSARRVGDRRSRNG